MENETNDKQETPKEAESVAEKSTDGNSDVGQPEAVDVVAEAKKVNAELKKNLEQKAKLLEKEEKLVARQEALKALGGGSPAGQTPAKPKEETPVEYKDRIMKGNI